MKTFLEEYRRKGLVKKEQIGFDQVLRHIIRAEKDLIVSNANLKIDAEAAYNYAYLAMLRSGRALMFSYGFRPVGGTQHKTVAAFCERLSGDEFRKLSVFFDRMRKKRNRFTYDEPGLLVSDMETKNALKNAKEFVSKISELISEKNPQRKLI